MPNAAQVRKGFAEYVNRVAYGNERVLIERRGRPIVALIDMTDYQILLDHEGRQDRADLAEAAAILAHPERHRWQTLDGTPVPAPKASRGAMKAAVAAELDAVRAEATAQAAFQRRLSSPVRPARKPGKVAKAGRR